MRKQLENLITVAWIFLFAIYSVSASEMPSGNCGYMCHVPMVGEGGGSLMTPRGLRPVEGDFSQMKTRFSIKPNQEAAWTKFAEAANKPVPNAHQAIQSNLPHSSVERAKFMEQIWRQRYEHMAAITSAFQDLYYVLDDQQKIVADQRFGYCEVAK
jgi:hypothetical protein